MRIQGDDGTVDGKRVGQDGVVHPITVADSRRNRKRRATAIALFLLLLPAFTPWAGPVAVSVETIGTWLMACESRRCVARHKDRLLEKMGVTADLEIRKGDAGFVPIVTLRGLPDQSLLAAAMVDVVKASIQVGPRQMRSEQTGPEQAKSAQRRPKPTTPAASADLACVSDRQTYVCMPQGSQAARLAAALPEARSLTIRLTATKSGRDQDLSRSKTLTLAETKEVLARLRASDVLQPPAKREPDGVDIPPGLAALLGRALLATRYGTDAAGLKALVTQYLKH